jgi:hypothetical protein
MFEEELLLGEILPGKTLLGEMLLGEMLLDKMLPSETLSERMQKHIETWSFPREFQAKNTSAIIIKLRLKPLPQQTVYNMMQ